MRNKFQNGCLAAMVALTFGSTVADAAELEFRATFTIDGKTTFDPADTVIIVDPDFGNVEIGDTYTVDFKIDTAQVDTVDTIVVSNNPVVESDIRLGNFGSVLTTANIKADPGNTGSFDPSGISFNPASASETSDGVAVWKINNAIANSEYIRLLTATDPTPPNLGGSLSDLIMNFRNIGTPGEANPVDYLDDRSGTVDPFDFDALFNGPSAVAGDANDLVLMTNDILGSGFSVDNINRPLSLAFGAAEVIPAIGPSFEQELYVWGTFDHVATVNTSGNATFKVIKTFDDGIDEEVDVRLSCNSGVDLVQDFTIQGGDLAGVTFTVEEFGDGTTCTVTETAGPDGYTPIFHGGNGCTFENIIPANYTCSIINEAIPGTYTVNMVWEQLGPGSVPSGYSQINISCDQDNGGIWQDPLWIYQAKLADGDSVTVSVDTSNGDANCWAVYPTGPIMSGVEIDNNCGPTQISAGEEESCVIMNTVFFEGIPTLDRYGLFLLALLSLGLGMFAVRRLV